MFLITSSWAQGPGAFAATGLYVVCAGIVTIDVLLKKSDVRGALGWIAVAWLSPFFGGVALLHVRHQSRHPARPQVRKTGQP